MVVACCFFCVSVWCMTKIAKLQHKKREWENKNPQPPISCKQMLCRLSSVVSNILFQFTTNSISFTYILLGSQNQWAWYLSPWQKYSACVNASDVKGNRRVCERVCMWTCRSLWQGGWVGLGEACWLSGQESDVTVLLGFDRPDFLSAGCFAWRVACYPRRVAPARDPRRHSHCPNHLLCVCPCSRATRMRTLLCCHCSCSLPLSKARPGRWTRGQARVLLVRRKGELKTIEEKVASSLQALHPNIIPVVPRTVQTCHSACAEVLRTHKHAHAPPPPLPFLCSQRKHLVQFCGGQRWGTDGL